MFSNEKPPKAFIETITNKDDLTKILYISDLNSDSFCETENPREFFVALANSTQSAAASEQEITTPTEIVKQFSEWDANKFTIVQHESEWHDEAESKSIFDTLLQMFKERYLELPFKLEHERQRVNKLVWMQDVANLGIGKHVWSWWPVISNNQLIYFPLFLEEYYKYFHHLNNTSERNLENIIRSVNSYYIDSPYEPTIDKLAYMLATAHHEMYHFLSGEYYSEKPEVGSLSYFNNYDPILADTQVRRDRAKRNGNIKEGDGYKYRGRGPVHLTWYNNYKQAGKFLGIDLVNNTELASKPIYAVPIMIWRMEERKFTGKKFSDFIVNNKIDFINSRKIINSLDQASLIQGYANNFKKILKISSNIGV